MLKIHIENLRPYVIDLFENDFSGHDIGHLERTMNTALYLQEKEGGDRLIIGISAFLHDVHKIMRDEAGQFVSPKDSLDIIRKILSNIDLTEEDIEKICYCIEYHEEYNWNGNNVEDINTLILQDADNLDALGAIGIGRAFSYGGAHNLMMYNPNIPLYNDSQFKEEKNDVSTIHHFYNKLLKLGEHMNTKTAKELAQEKTRFMQKFVDEFLKEWNAKY